MFSSCGDDTLSIEEQLKVDTGLIEDYLKSKNLTAQKTSDGIYYIIQTEGSVEKPKITTEVTVTYKGYFLTSFKAGRLVFLSLVEGVKVHCLFLPNMAMALERSMAGLLLCWHLI